MLVQGCHVEGAPTVFVPICCPVDLWDRHFCTAGPIAGWWYPWKMGRNSGNIWAILDEFSEWGWPGWIPISCIWLAKGFWGEMLRALRLNTFSFGWTSSLQNIFGEWHGICIETRFGSTHDINSYKRVAASIMTFVGAHWHTSKFDMYTFIPQLATAINRDSVFEEPLGFWYPNVKYPGVHFCSRFSYELEWVSSNLIEQKVLQPVNRCDSERNQTWTRDISEEFKIGTFSPLLLIVTIDSWELLLRE